MNNWIPLKKMLPPENVKIETVIWDEKGFRNQQTLIRKGNLYFFTDMSMYVYYTPTHWRSIGNMESATII